MVDVKRIRKAMRVSFKAAHAAVVEARESKAAGYSIGYRAALETVTMHRKLNSDRRRAIRLGRCVEMIK